MTIYQNFVRFFFIEFQNFFGANSQFFAKFLGFFKFHKRIFRTEQKHERFLLIFANDSNIFGKLKNFRFLKFKFKLKFKTYVVKIEIWNQPNQNWYINYTSSKSIPFATANPTAEKSTFRTFPMFNRIMR